MSLTVAQAAFVILSIASVVCALLAVTRKNPVHSMLWVLGLFLNVAGLFLLLSAEFVAAVQVIVYAGAILIFYLFVVMLLDLPGEETGPRFGSHWPLAALAGLSFAGLGWLAQLDLPEVLAATPTLEAAQPSAAPGVGAQAVPDEAAEGAESIVQGSVAELGAALFGPFALPFELASLVLLAAIVGAVVLARKRGIKP